MKFLHETVAAVVISTTAVFSGLSENVRAATLTGNQSLTNTGFQKQGPMSKVGSHLASLYAAHETPPRQSETTSFQSAGSLLQVDDKYVNVNAVASKGAKNLLTDLKELGLKRASKFRSTVSGRLPIEAINQMSDLDSLRFAKPAYRPLSNVGQITSQGDTALRADVARSKFNVDGTGVTVGVLADSFNNLGSVSDDVTSGDLPSGIKVLKDLPSSGTDEGRSMMQIIHDVAPGADLAFHTAFVSQTDYAKGIRKLAKAGADVIVDDVVYEEEPMFQDGILAQAVDTVVDKGIPYFGVAGNYGRSAYESAFDSSGIENSKSGGELHDFDPGTKVDTFQSITVPKGSGFRVSFQWDSPFYSVSPGSGGSANDLDVFLFDDSTKKLLASSRDNNVGRDPVEIFEFANDGSYKTDKFNLAIANSEGRDPELMKYVLYGFEGTINEFDTASPTLYGHANADGAEAVGAAFYEQTPEFGTDPAVLEQFSSTGGTPILFDTEGNRLENPEIRQKPEIIAPDRTYVAAREGDGLASFIGTSAAAPHAAAVAALMLDAAPGTSPSKIYSTLEDTALDMDDPSTPGFDSGFDSASGYGLIQADRAVKAVPEPNSVLGVLAFGALCAGSRLRRFSSKKGFSPKTCNGLLKGFLLAAIRSKKL